MNWDNVETRCEMIFQGNLIVKITPIERKIYIGLMADELPEIPRVRIASILDRVIKRIELPINRKTFLKTVHHSLR